jgi:ABC-type amino acid transport substrate-binding protein
MLKFFLHVVLAMLLVAPTAFADQDEAPKKRPTLKERLKKAYEKAKKAAKKAVKATKKAAKKAAKATKKAAKKALKKAKKATKKAVKATKKAYKKAKDATKKATKKAGVATKKALVKAKDATKKAADATKKAYKKAEKATKKAYKKAADATKKALVKAKDATKKAADATKKAAKATGKALKKALKRKAPEPVAVQPIKPGQVTQVFTPTNTLKPPKGTAFALLLKSGIVRVCVRSDAPPFGFFQGQTLTGFDIELAKKIVTGISIRYNTRLKLQWNITNASGRLPALKQGRCDLVVATFSKTPAREKEVAFSTVYLKTRKVLLRASKISRKTPVLATVAGATAPAVAVQGATLATYFNYNDILETMKRGLTDFILADHPTANYLLRNSKGYSLSKVLPMEEHYAVGMHKHHTQLKAEVDAILSYLGRSGYLAHFKRQWIP